MNDHYHLFEIISTNRSIQLLNTHVVEEMSSLNVLKHQISDLGLLTPLFEPGSLCFGAKVSDQVGMRKILVDLYLFLKSIYLTYICVRVGQIVNL